MAHNTAESAKLRAIVDDVLDRRAAGESLTDEDVLSSHPDLAPALKLELRLLGLVEAAAFRARSGASSSRSAQMSSGQGDANADTVAASNLSRLTNVGRAPNVPGYAIEGEAHRGGQGVVFRATQIATGRTVAIKALRDHALASSADLARFDREVRILAKLRHPGIVTIHDSGVVDGVFYFVMDFVEGATLTEYANTSKLSLRARLALFAQVCDAVHAAHLAGVIHRDLKPGNILVGADGTARVLDFGLAKADDDSEAAMTAMTQTGQFLGSLPWAAPEQAEGHTHLIDLRTDVYALGVVLFQLLTGRFPYDVSGSMREVVDNILNKEPALAGASFNEDLKTIVRKALSKERERRYQSARELAMDIRAYLAGEPLLARRDSFGYVLRKQLRRHWLPVSVGVAFVALLAVGFGVSLTLWRVAESQRIRAEEQSDRAEKAAFAAEREAENANRETERALLIIDYLRTIMRSDNPGDPQSADMTMRDMLGRAHRGLAPPAFEAHPDVRKELLSTLGATYLSFGMFAEAEQLYLETIEAAQWMGPVEVALQRNNYANVIDDLGRYQEAADLYKAALDVLMADRPGHVQVARTANNYANALANLGRIDEAIEYYRMALAIHRENADGDNFDLATTMSSFGVELGDRGQHEEAEQLLLEALAMHERLMGPDHISVSLDLNNLGSLYNRIGRDVEALDCVERSYEIRRTALGPDHPENIVILNNLATANFQCGHRLRAEKLMRDCIDLQRRTIGETPELVNSLLNLAVFVGTRGDYQTALPLVREARDIALGTVGPTHRLTGRAYFGLATICLATSDWDEAEDQLDKAFAILVAGADPHPVIAIASFQAALRLRADDVEGARVIMERCNQLTEKRIRRDYRYGLADMMSAVLMARQGAHDKARALALESLPETAETSVICDVVAVVLRIAAGAFSAEGLEDVAAECRATADALDERVRQAAAKAKAEQPSHLSQEDEE